MWLCGYAVLIVVSGTILGQSPGTSPSPTFDSAVVQASAPGITPVMTGGVLRGGRYELHNATMLDMIRTAWGIDADKVIGGPNWLENDRFDVVASTAPATSQDTALLMLQALLADRFRLVVHSDRKPLPAFALTVGKHPRLKKAEGTGDTGCRLRQQSMSLAGHIQNAVTVCQNLTMSAFAARIPSIAGTYIEHPVIDQTGLTGMWDFNITWTARQLLGLAGADGIAAGLVDPPFCGIERVAFLSDDLVDALVLAAQLRQKPLEFGGVRYRLRRELTDVARGTVQDDSSPVLGTLDRGE